MKVFNCVPKKSLLYVASSVLLLALCGGPALAHRQEVDGIPGPAFTFTAAAGRVSTGDGGSIYAWGYANGNGAMQYPGPTMVVREGETVEVTLTNTLPDPVSIVFPGQAGVTASGGTPGVMTNEATAGGGSVTYSFVARKPGTYLYHSGTRPEVQVEMGLVGALIVRPANFDEAAPRAYAHEDSRYNSETLFLLTEMDPRIHETIETQGIAGLNGTDYLTKYFPVYWFINGRTAPDTMHDTGTGELPHQPYNCMPEMHPGDKLLLRIIGAGRAFHPFHTHGNHTRVIARNGEFLSSMPGMGADLSHEVFTVASHPGQTADAIFEWTGKGLGWDIYGHAPGDTPAPHEDMDDHGKAFPVTLPENQNLAFGPWWSGSPFLGRKETLPNGAGLMNSVGEYFHMWHSHSEKELVNFDIFPGGMMTMVMIHPHQQNPSLGNTVGPAIAPHAGH